MIDKFYKAHFINELAHLLASADFEPVASGSIPVVAIAVTL